MTANLIASLLAALILGLIVALTWLLTRMIFPDERGILYCPRWLSVRWHVRFLERTTWLRKLAEAIHIAAAFYAMPDVEHVILAPKGSWAVLNETLEKDAVSKFFDETLKDKIRHALCDLVVW